MWIETTRFGRLDVDDACVLSFPRGLLGFPNYRGFALLQTGEDDSFYWLQSTEEPGLAFIVTDPVMFFRDFRVPVREEVAADLNVPSEADQSAPNPQMRVLTICNKVGDWLTGNLLGPIVVHVAEGRGAQVVLTEKKWSTRQPLMRLGAEQPARKVA